MPDNGKAFFNPSSMVLNICSEKGFSFASNPSPPFTSTVIFIGILPDTLKSMLFGISAKTVAIFVNEVLSDPILVCRRVAAVVKPVVTPPSPLKAFLMLPNDPKASAIDLAPSLNARSIPLRNVVVLAEKSPISNLTLLYTPLGPPPPPSAKYFTAPPRL